jgi:hypothetical protein
MSGDPAAAYGPKPANVGSVASHVHAAPSVDDQIPPRQLVSPLGPVARKPVGVAATPKTWPSLALSTLAGAQDWPSAERQAVTVGA